MPGRDTFCTRLGTCEDEEYSFFWGKDRLATPYLRRATYAQCMYEISRVLMSLLFVIKDRIAVAQQLRKTLPALVFSATPRNDGLLVRTTPGALRALAYYLCRCPAFQLKSLVDIAVVDRLRSSARFSINYLFFSANTNQRLLVQIFADETTTIPSLSVPFANGQRLFAAGG